MKLKFLILILGLTFSGFSSRFYQAFAQETPEKSADFRDVVEKRLLTFKMSRLDGKIIKAGIKLKDVCPIDDDRVARRVFVEYGAIFIVANNVQFPIKCIFENETEVLGYQNSAKPKTEVIGGTTITLQEPAMNALLEAIKEAKQKNLRITPRGGSIAASRSYQDTARLWDSRFYPALNHWVGKGKISRKDAEMVKGWQIHQQVAKVLEWEDKGLYFSKDLSKSILYSVAAPGASQHIFMLALDVEQFANKKVREILANHGWFQTVKSDLPHFTYLGFTEESELRALGLKPVPAGGQIFWIPNIVEPTKKLEVKEQ